MKIVVLPLAATDIEAACSYYDERGAGTDRLMDDLERLLSRLEVFPRSGRAVAGYDSVRRASLRRFPFAVFYQLTEPDRIDILRVLHTARSDTASLDT